MVDPPLAMKCIVINLPRAAARRRAMRSQFEALGIEFEIFNATDWRDLNEEDWTHVDRESRDMEGRRPLSDGMIACHMSHRKALGSVAAGEDELVAVFEDDVTLAPEIGGALDALARLYSSGWEFDFVFSASTKHGQTLCASQEGRCGHPVGHHEVFRLGSSRICNFKERSDSLPETFSKNSES